MLTVLRYVERTARRLGARGESAAARTASEKVECSLVKVSDGRRTMTLFTLMAITHKRAEQPSQHR